MSLQMVSLFAFLEAFNLFTQVFPVSKVKKKSSPVIGVITPSARTRTSFGRRCRRCRCRRSSSSSNKKVSFALLTSTQRCPSFFKQPNFLRPEFISSIRTKAAKYEYWPEGQVRWTTFGDILEQIKKFFVSRI